MKVFVTGASGFVGRYVVKELLAQGFEVFAGARNTGKVDSVFGKRVSPVSVDFNDINSIRKALLSVRPDTIVHLIGIIAEIPSRGVTFEKVHWGIPRDIYVAAGETGVKKVAHMSALGVHPDAPSHYHRTKLKAEQELRASGIAFTIFRPSMIMGPEHKLFSDMKKFTKIIPVVALPDGGRHLMQPVDVRDVACSFAASLAKSGTDNKAYELCGPDQVSFRNILTDIFSSWRKKVIFVSVPTPAMIFAGKIFEKMMSGPPFTADVIRMMWRDNVCGIYGDAEAGGVREVCGRAPIPFHESLEWSLGRR